MTQSARRQPHGHGRLLSRLEIIRRWNELEGAAARTQRPRGQAKKQLLAELESRGISLSLSTLYNWRRAFLADGVKGLADHRARKGRQPPDKRFMRAVQREYELPEMLSMEAAHMMARREARKRGWRICTLRESCQYIRRKVLPAMRRGSGAV